MTFTVSYSIQFATNLARFPKPDQMKIAIFADKVEREGLADFSKYPGKITVSWGGDLRSDEARFKFAYGNDLWHYHIGIPEFVPSKSQPYGTSDWCLHFQWPKWQLSGAHIHIVDLLQHDESSSDSMLSATSSTTS